MVGIFARCLALAAIAVPLGGCLSISWQDDPAPVASATMPNGTAAQAPAADHGVPCNYSQHGGWDSSGASRDIYGAPKEFECPKSAVN